MFETTKTNKQVKEYLTKNKWEMGDLYPGPEAYFPKKKTLPHLHFTMQAPKCYFHYKSATEIIEINSWLDTQKIPKEDQTIKDQASELMIFLTMTSQSPDSDIDIRQIQSREQYIKDLDLAVPAESLLSLSAEKLAFNEEGETAFVDSGSTVSFVGGVPLVKQQDVLNSTLLAQLAANKKYDRESQTEAWYGYYREVLENVGWVVQSFSFTKYTETGATIKLDKTALAIIAEIASGNELTVLASTLKALEESDPDSKQTTLFDSNGSQGEAGNFQLSTASVDPNGNIQMTLGAFYFKSSEHKSRFLFVTWSTKNINLYFGAQSVILNEQIYATVRQTVIDKLGDNAQKFVADLDI